MEDMRRIVIEAADVLTVLKREKKPRGDEGQLAESAAADELASDELPPDLARLEDTILQNDDSSSEPLPADPDAPGA
jgi:hypothetical protein